MACQPSTDHGGVEIPGPAGWTLVLDESLNKRLAAELSQRGRDAWTVYSLQYAGLNDPDLLHRLTERVRNWILVTADDRMPADHGTTIAEFGATIATIDPRAPASYWPDQWRRDVVHRWAHVMGGQEGGSIRRYSFRWHRLWTPRRRGRRMS